jgi:hypothetical protein
LVASGEQEDHGCDQFGDVEALVAGLSSTSLDELLDARPPLGHGRLSSRQAIRLYVRPVQERGGGGPSVERVAVRVRNPKQLTDHERWQRVSPGRDDVEGVTGP